MDQARLEELRRDDEIRRAALEHEQEIRALRSDVEAMQGRMVNLLNKLHAIDPYGSKSFNPRSTEVRTQSLTNTGLNGHWQRADRSSVSS